MSLATLRVPIAIVCSLIFFVLGLGAGMLSMGAFGYKWDRMPMPAAPPPNGAGPMMAAPPGMGGPGMGGPGMGKGKGGPTGPTAKAQLRDLVVKLDQLTAQPLTVNLNSDQKQQVRKLLDGLADLEELQEEDAKNRLDSLTELLKDQREVMTAAGYRWPGDRPAGSGFGGGKQAEPKNPFAEGANAKHLKSLQMRVSKS